MKCERPKLWSWYLPKLTKEQAARLKDGLMSRFRFQLDLMIPKGTVGFMPKKKVFWIKLSPSCTDYVNKLEGISCYVNGFYQAIDL
jgi:hypothetical protein